MKYKTLGKTGIEVSAIGLGCQSLGGGLYYRSRRASTALVQRAVDEGITLFDTSDHYSQGLSEQWLGEAIRGRRHKVVLATKAGTRYTPFGYFAGLARPALRPFSRLLQPFKLSLHRMRAAQKRQDFSPEYLHRAVEASLKRLGTDYLDLFQLHKPPGDELVSAGWLDAVEQLKKQGKIRAWGVSCGSLEDAWLCLNHIDGLSSLQVGLSLLELDALGGFLDQARARSVSVLARNPRAQGYLTAGFGDIMAETYARTRLEAEKKRQRAKRLSFLVTENRTLAQAALRFVLDLPGVTAAIPRAVNVAQLLENLGALDAEALTAGEIATVLDLNEVPNREVA